MRDLLRRLGSVALALAAFNAGPAAVAGFRPHRRQRRDARLRRAHHRPDDRRRRADRHGPTAD
jgi:soluble lytic murein transglycosylase-like protein